MFGLSHIISIFLVTNIIRITLVSYLIIKKKITKIKKKIQNSFFKFTQLRYTQYINIRYIMINLQTL